MDTQAPEAELDAARTQLHEAQAHHRIAVRIARAVITEKARKKAQRDAANDVKAFQQSEARKRSSY